MQKNVIASIVTPRLRCGFVREFKQRAGVDFRPPRANS